MPLPARWTGTPKHISLPHPHRPQKIPSVSGLISLVRKAKLYGKTALTKDRKAPQPELLPFGRTRFFFPSFLFSLSAIDFKAFSPLKCPDSCGSFQGNFHTKLGLCLQCRCFRMATNHGCCFLPRSPVLPKELRVGTWGSGPCS